ncbi:A/G-specific adenine glycosylase [Buchnera aphidicola]|uniref:Adenine DNA glycosylase n=1 Tax=Buchnera aphidicola (Sarucallis kahawaluokalani) TaxID=1241878 RepID=A0A4D6YMA5_9GAMM|nr:A/G-specific adenine glycosylase [Buchnera aphidicola]QCI26155.1 A/G-specific adenine glycosylase [Buchnera aphidicola (Sarucallis kahawaluokalani)]
MQPWKFSQIIINWQHQFGRNNLPWQKNNDPYRIWISEIMLQQTQVITVIPYFKKFIHIFKDVQSLAQTNLNQVLYLWSGLGYYHRACNIYKTAQIIHSKYYNNFPKQFIDLIKLPGIGKTTAHAILSFAYNYSFPILDSNVKRILIRFYQIQTHNINKYTQEKILWNIINYMSPIHNTKKFNQGMMDLGAIICIHKNPKCSICPIKNSCKSYVYAKNIPSINFIKKKNKKKCFFYIILQYKKYIFLEYRNKKNIWKNLFCFPEFYNLQEMQYWLYKYQISNTKYKKYYYMKHQFSHFTLKMVLIHVILKKKNYKKKHDIWYNLKKNIKIGIPKPIKDVLLNLYHNPYF